MRTALVVGGANGIGLSIATELANRDDYKKVYILDKAQLDNLVMNEKFEYVQFDLTSQDFSVFDSFDDVDTLMITAGFGRLALFEDLEEQHIVNIINVNTTAVIRIIHHFYHKIKSDNDFRCGVMVSIAGFMTSPFFSVYGATKAALKIFIESVNAELTKAGVENRILNVSPGSIKGTSFNDEKTDLTQTQCLARQIIDKLENKEDLFIPQYEEIYKTVLSRYQSDFRAEGLHSYDYKLNSGRIKKK